MSQKPIINNIIETFGINRKTTLDSFKKNGFNIKKSIKFLNSKQRVEINKSVGKNNTGKKLSASIKENLEFLSRIKTYRGLRHKFKYPSRGQRTHTNAKTKQKFKF
jgi:small subunit ribosomal protein S13